MSCNKKARSASDNDADLMSCNKKARFASNNDEDRISNLDENVLSHVLSFLPTKEVFRTSVLSKQWRYKWRYSYTMEVDDGKYRSFCKEETFVQLVTRLLFFSQRLKTFSIRMNNNSYDSRRVHSWISTVLRHDLENLLVWCFKGPEIVFPGSLLNSTLLRTLSLRQAPKCTMNVAIRNCAPNLTSLWLEGVDIVNQDSSSTTVKFRFPVLENLRLLLCRWVNVKLVEIDAPSLTTFDSMPGDGQWLYEYGHSIQISAPRLANFMCRNVLPENYTFCKGTGGGSIISAVFDTDLDIEDDTSPEVKSLFARTGLRVGNYINNFTNLQELELSDFMSRILPLTCLRLDKLRRLKLIYAPNAEKLFQILHMTPSLKFLCIDLFCWRDNCDYERSLLPTCILYHLEEVEFIDFYIELPDLFHLPDFFVKNAEQLKKLRFIVMSDPQESKEVLPSYYRSSPNLAIEVVEKPTMY